MLRVLPGPRMLVLVSVLVRHAREAARKFAKWYELSDQLSAILCVPLLLS